MQKSTDGFHGFAVLSTFRTASNIERMWHSKGKRASCLGYSALPDLHGFYEQIHLRSFDSLVAHTSIVFLLSQDERSHGGLFAALCDELEDISLKQAFELLFAYL